jgi:hypothetical protein
MTNYANTISRALDYLAERKENSLSACTKQLSYWKQDFDYSRPKPLLLNCTPEKEIDDLITSFNYKQIHYNSEKMLINGLKQALGAVSGEKEAVPSIRANMGCGIFPTLFGISQNLYEDKMPWVKEHLTKDVLAKKEPYHLKIGKEFEAGLSHMSYISEKVSGTGCLVYPMDLQGAFDTAHIVFGDQIFYELFDDPGFVHHLLELSCEAIFMGMRACLEIIPDSDKMVAHYNNLVIPSEMGGIKISEDTSTLLSKDQIDEFVSPYMKKILEYFNGGYIHYCGKNPHLFEACMNEPKAYGFNLGNTDMHDMEKVLNRCAREGKIYYGSIEKSPEESLEDYFTKYLKASECNKKCYLLMQYTCDPYEKDEVINTWNKF